VLHDNDAKEAFPTSENSPESSAIGVVAFEISEIEIAVETEVTDTIT